MRLTGEDREFLERLAPLLRSRLVKLSQDRVPPHDFVLTCPSWSEAERQLRMSRQAIRRRTWRLFNQLCIPACETVMLVERHLGPRYRQTAMAVAGERLTRLATSTADACFQSADSLLPFEPPCTSPGSDRPLPGIDGGSGATRYPLKKVGP